MPELHEPFTDRLDVRTHAALHQSTPIAAIAPPAAEFPTAPTTGQIFYETDTGLLYVWNGVIWKSVLPSATILAFGGATIPEAFFLCDGQELSRTTYAGMYQGLGGASSPWGQGNGTTTFNTPNLKGKVIVHRNSADALWDVLGESRGAATVVLTDANLSSHEHSLNNHVHDMAMHIHTLGGHTHGTTNSQNTNHHHQFAMQYTGLTSHNHAAGVTLPAEGPSGGGVGLIMSTDGVSANHQHTTNGPNVNATAGISPSDTSGASGNTGTIGSDTAHDNVQPSTVCNYIIAA